ncbi:MAG: YfcC family protein, partial [Bacteroidales bacterium]|nr:YfcC family protein [Bacteroidales bacterium]
MGDKQWRIPHTFTIVLIVVLAAAALTWVLPGGMFERETVPVAGSGLREVVVPGSYHRVERQAQTWQFFSAFYDGFVKTAGIIVFIFMVGGAFWIVNATGSIGKGVQAFLQRVERLKGRRLFRHMNVNFLIISLIMVMFSLFGAIFGMSEETLAFMVIFVPLAISMGYDSLVGMGMCYLAAHVGFAGGMLNPFTIGIAQGLAGLPPFSGLAYR